MNNEYEAGRDVDENMFNHCDSGCLACDCIVCKQLGSDLAKSYNSLQAQSEE